MVVEDAHWIDPTSQELVEALAMRLPALRLMLVVTYRPQRPHEYAPSWGQSAFASTVTLTGLAAEQGEQLAATSPASRRCRTPCSLRSSFAPTASRCTSRADQDDAGIPQLLEEAHRYTLLEPMPALSIPRTLEALLIERRAAGKE